MSRFKKKKRGIKIVPTSELIFSALRPFPSGLFLRLNLQISSKFTVPIKKVFARAMRPPAAAAVSQIPDMAAH